MMSATASSLDVVYLDYAATTPVDERVAALMTECLTSSGSFGNPGSASHAYGTRALALVDRARAQVAAAVGAVPEDIVWTSGATEANNLALFGIADHFRGAGHHVVTSRLEHKAVLDPCRELERRGWRVSYLVPGPDGLISAREVKEALRPDTVLVSIMHVNNETGLINDVREIATVCAEHAVRLHVDAAQSIGKIAVDFDGWGIDLLSLSGHKAYGPKGVGALVVSRRRGVRLNARQFGGGQERNLRSGTVPTHQVVGMGAAFELAVATMTAESERVAGLRCRLWSGLASLNRVLRNGSSMHTVPHILNASFEDVEGESLLATVRSRLAVSTGSACMSATSAPSYVLRALGREEALAESSLRFSLGRFTSDAHIQAAVESLTRGIQHLRAIGGRGAGADAGAAVLAGSPRPPDYNDLTWRHFTQATHCGTLQGCAVHRGVAGSTRLGTWIQFDLQVSDEHADRLSDARFFAIGCPHTIAVANWLASTASSADSSRSSGRADACELPESVAALRERFGVPIEKMGRLLIIEDAWRMARSSALAMGSASPDAGRVRQPT